MQQRWLDKHGRFLSVDPVGFNESNPMSFNRYIYANDNPYKFVDPDGRETTINITREVYSDNSIISTYTVTSDKTTAQASGYMLENSVAGVSGVIKRPIPEDSYAGFVRDSDNSDPDKIQLITEEGYRDVQIHVGNRPGDVEGCFAPGTTFSTDSVSGSETAMNGILNVISEDGSGKITVNVTGDNRMPLERR